VARLTQLEPTKPEIRFGGLKGKIWIADDFDAPLPAEVLAEFEGDIFPSKAPPADESTKPEKKAKGFDDAPAA